MPSLSMLKCGVSCSVPRLSTGTLVVPRTCGAMTTRRSVVAKAADAAVKLADTNGAVPEVSQPAKDDVQGDMLEPSVVNKGGVRAGAVLAAVAAAAAGTTVLPTQAVSFVHVLSFAVFFGTNLWNTFFVGLTMFKNMPRQTFGRVQSKLFPAYFALTSSANVLMIGTLVAAGQPLAAKPVIALAISLLASLGNWLLLEPLATKLMFQRYDIENKVEKSEEDKEQIKALYKQFGKWHGISSLLNLVTFCVGAAHAWTLAGGLTL